jgi:ParB family chromosome partitioning protein
MGQLIEGTFSKNEVLTVKWSRIRFWRKQPRKHFNQEKLIALGTSIKEIGQLQPVEVKVVTDDPRYDFELVDGERRWRACEICKIETMRVLVVTVENEEEQFERSVAANFGQEPLLPLEAARAIERMFNSNRLAGFTKQRKFMRIGALFMRSEQWAEMHLNLLKLHPDVLRLMDPDITPVNTLGVSMGTFLVTLADTDLQRSIASQVVKKGLKVKEARRLAKTVAKDSGKQIGRRPRRPSDDHWVVKDGIERITFGVETIMEFPEKRLREIFERRDPSEIREFLERIDESIEGLKEIKQAVQRMLRIREAVHA